MRIVFLIVTSILAICCLYSPLMADVTEPELFASAGPFLKSMTFHKGFVELSNGIAVLNIPKDFRYIGPEDSQRFLEQGWGNRNGSGQIGMLLPMDTDPFGDYGWAVIISYREDGYIPDNDAAMIDYDALLRSMQEATRENNTQRLKMGFSPVTLVGWAAKPRYDHLAKKLYWAKELRSGDNPHHILNYNIRLLGRKGVLVMNAVSRMDQLPAVQERMEQVISFVNFSEGYRYSEFNPDVDKVAAYGISTLIRGKMETKSGLLEKLGGTLVTYKMYIILGCIALFGIVTLLLNLRKAEITA